jgi:hypothetical protein
MRSRTAGLPRLDVSIAISAHPALVLRAFFDPPALGAWLRALRSVTTPRTLGVYAIEWPASALQDDVLGRLGGTFRGTVIQFEPGHGFFIADAYWLPPDGDPIGPMAINVTCAVEQPTADAAPSDDVATRVHVEQSGFEEGPRWRRYYELSTPGLERALTTLKMLLER